MRILQLVQDLGTVGGIERVVDRWSRRLLECGHDTLVLVSGSVPSDSRPYVWRAAPGFAEPAPGARIAEAAVLAQADAFAADVVVSHHTRDGRLLTRITQSLPIVEVIHTLLCGGGKLFRRDDRPCTYAVGPACLARWYTAPCGSHRAPWVAARAHIATLRHLNALRQLDAVAVGSVFMRDYLLSEGVPAHRIWLADLAVNAPPEAPRHAMRGAPRLLFVGRLVYNKGVQYALEAFAALDATWTFTIVGDGFYRPALERRASELGITDRVQFAGQLEGQALAAEYDRASVLVVPSLVPEPVGLVVAEGRAHGLPVAAFDVGGLGEWAQRYADIHLAAPANARALGRAIRRAIYGAHAPRQDGAPVRSTLEAIAAQALARRKRTDLRERESVHNIDAEAARA